jgi:hypothetical protein
MRETATRYRRQEATEVAQTLAEALMEQGRTEGRVEGLVEAKQDDVLVLLWEKFGPAPAWVSERVRAVKDAATLDVLLKRVLHADSLEAMGL